MNRLRIGTAGIPLSTKMRSTSAGIKRLVELELDCMELEFVRSVSMNSATAEDVKKLCAATGIELTVHAPYYVNLNSQEPDKVAASKERVLKAARIGWIAGAQSVVFHAAYYHDKPHEEAYQKVKQELIELRRKLDAEGISICLRPETTGSLSQFGTVEETVRLAGEIPGVFPCIDWSHLHARSQGAYNTYEEICQVLEFVQTELGKEALTQLHMHISGIDYGAKGEKKHLVLTESDMNYQAVLQALVEYNVGGWLICESPNLETDALLLKQEYNRLLNLAKEEKIHE